MVNLQRPVDDAITFWGMLLIVTLVSTVWILQFARYKRRYGVVVFVVVSIVTGVNLISDQYGIFNRLDLLPPPFVMMNVAILLLVFAVGFGYLGQLGDMMVKHMTVRTLVSLQIFRLPLELLMLRAAYLEIMPMEFSMKGYNLDVLTGLGALLLTIYAVWKRSLPKMLVWVWNVMGIFLLLVIAVLALLTSPNVHAFGTAPIHINSWVLYFPYSLLPSILVSFAVLGHVLLTRKLLHHEQSI
jgi:hypothetical protein